MASDINTANRSSLSEFIKVHYAKPILDVWTNSDPFVKLIKKKANYKSTERAGGRVLEFPYQLKGIENVGLRARGETLPGFSGTSNDDLDTYDGQTASIDRVRMYNGFAFDGEWMTSSNKAHLFEKSTQFANSMKDAIEAMARDCVIQLLGDRTGVLGVATAVSTTTVTMTAANDINVRGRNGNVCFRPNQKVEWIQAAHFASSALVSQADSTLGISKVDTVSSIADVGSAPTVVFTENQATAGVQVGDVAILSGSRTKTAGGSATGATLNTMNGIFNLVDDGTLSSALYGITRASYGALNSPTNLSTVGRTPTWTLFQSIASKLERRGGANHLKGLAILSEFSVRDGFVAQDGQPLKRYVQEGKALTHLAGFEDVMMAFLGAGRPMPWVCSRDYPYGHAHIINLDDVYGMWDKEPSVLDHDGVTVRNRDGYDEFYVMFAAYGNIMMERPFLNGRISGLQGTF